MVSLALASRSKAAAQHPDFSQALMAEFMQMMSCLRSQQFQAVVVSHSLLSPCRTSSWTLTTCIDSSSCIANSHAFPFSQAVITQLKEMMSCFTLTSSAPTGMACWRSTGRTQHPVVTGDVRKYPASCRNISSSKLRAASALVWRRHSEACSCARCSPCKSTFDALFAGASKALSLFHSAPAHAASASPP